MDSPERIGPEQILICHHRACFRQGSQRVMAAFQALLDRLEPQPDPPNLAAELVASGCLGRCGSGPMVLVLPQQQLYRRVDPTQVSAIWAGSLAGADRIPG